MSLLKRSSSRKIHTRTIEMSTYETDKGDIIVEGILKDNRLIPYYRPSGEKRPPHTVHHMVIRMRIGASSFSIEDIEAEMPEIPQDECPQTSENLLKIKGMKIAPGFTEKVKKRLGGINGCSHLTALVHAMASAAVQGIWVYNSRKPENAGMSLDMLDDYLIDTCWVWRKDGPLETRLKKELKYNTAREIQ